MFFVSLRLNCLNITDNLLWNCDDDDDDGDDDDDDHDNDRYYEILAATITCKHVYNYQYFRQ